jgi:SAM-dependent methyltransferase
MLPDARLSVRETLLRIGAIKSTSIEVFAGRTRDCSALTVYRDIDSKVIFVDEFYVGDDEYRLGAYRAESKANEKILGINFEDTLDSERRFGRYRQFIAAKDICDFGCGAGNFLKLAQCVAKSVTGVELQADFARSLNSYGIPCYQTIAETTGEFDFVTMFHCLEHLPDPLTVLGNIFRNLKKAGMGRVLIEVPHARDFLLDQLVEQSFIEFTLWSQHLVLHTRESLQLLLGEVGFRNIVIEGVQRYGLANHLHWLARKRPGGHKEDLSIIETEELKNAYAAALCSINANDTLVATATT